LSTHEALASDQRVDMDSDRLANRKAETGRQTGKHLARQMSDKPRGEKELAYTLAEC